MKKPQIKNTSRQKKTTKSQSVVRKADEKKNAKTQVKAYDEAMTDAFIKEVDEEVHNDELKVFWNKYGLFVVLFIVLAVSAAVSFETIKNWRKQQFQAQTDSYLAAVQGMESTESTIKALEKIAAGDNGLFSELARVQIATILFEQDRPQDAESMLQAIIDNEELSPKITHMAAVKLATYKVDTASEDELNALLQPVIAANDAWTPLAQELLAMAAIRDGQLEKARDIYSELLENPEISANFKARIQDILSALNDM